MIDADAAWYLHLLAANFCHKAVKEIREKVRQDAARHWLDINRDQHFRNLLYITPPATLEVILKTIHLKGSSPQGPGWHWPRS